ncbi:hypothetical protein Srot_0279 [Segniliparus rotundus DSM 44985]|uniref:Pilin n=1 Tax=Segniliparus rotundus (strain ATCC BAA-972 / CDC 1076 / CIP 108378 / DSM 44985 / JCM 13578) TaxID=640132 RepID=D6ZB07_SEGRD|nr:hypothetical protein [Segniliparus rotundus]ADG96766.1 hypothetical protein Srot_0279 [Segniliparus rotundus DSM 44985]
MKTMTAALFATAVCGAAFLAPSPALAAPAPGHHDKQWCPGQPWDEEWGVNDNPISCHAVDTDEDDEGLDDDAPDPDLGVGVPKAHPDGEYPPDYDWSDRYEDNHGGRHG